MVFDHVTDMLTNKKFKHLIVSGPSGIGKTHSILSAVKILEEETTITYHRLNGHVTPLSLYLALWKTRDTDSILVVDDFGRDRGLCELLKMAMDPTYNIVSYPRITAASIVAVLEEQGFTDVPPEFEFNGHIVIATTTDMNKPNLHADLQALKSRAWHLATPTPPQIVKPNQSSDYYKDVFTTASGQKVLDDLERIVNQLRIDGEDPNPNAAVWKCAQQALLQRIHNQISE
jgi:hypothetical protein